MSKEKELAKALEFVKENGFKLDKKSPNEDYVITKKLGNLLGSITVKVSFKKDTISLFLGTDDIKPYKSLNITVKDLKDIIKAFR